MEEEDLTQQQIKKLLEMPKKINEFDRRIILPETIGTKKIKLISLDRTKLFLVDIERKDRRRLYPPKYTYQKRYQTEIILLRLDIGSRAHRNPDGTSAKINHLHIWTENFKDGWAYELPDIFTNITDLVTTLIDFFKYCNVINVHDVNISLQERVF